MAWHESLGLSRDHLRLRAHGEHEKAHYALASSDIEYRFPWGWGELEGIARRGDYDLRRHQEVSGHDLQYTDPSTNERYLPYVVEPAVGVDRIFLALLLDAYAEEEVRRDPSGAAAAPASGALSSCRCCRCRGSRN